MTDHEDLTTIKLTPLQDALLDGIIARYRLGEHEWSVKLAGNRAALDALIRHGIITVRTHNASTEYAYAALTMRAIKEFVLAGEYKAPLMLEVENLRTQVNGYAARNQELLEEIQYMREHRSATTT